MKYQIVITTAYPKDYAALFSLVVNSGLKANITAEAIDSDTPDPVLPSASASADVAPFDVLSYVGMNRKTLKWSEKQNTVFIDPFAMAETIRVLIDSYSTKP